MSQALNYTLPEHLRVRRAAQRSERTVQVVALILAVLCLLGAGLINDPLNRLRKENQLVIDPSTTKGLPPDIALLGRLGTFRALAIDWASIRAERLKEQGKTYEAHDLHKVICKLQPRFPRVWIIAAWNMAYNISVSQYTPEARWQWVTNGIKLLRDDGLRYNPRSVAIYRELAWIYWHKMGDFLDDEHRSYRKALAVEMERVLGAQPLAFSEEEYYIWFKKIVDAPRDLKGMIENDPEVKRLVERLELHQVAPDEALLELVARYIRPQLSVYDLQMTDRVEDPVVSLLKDPKVAPARDRLLAAVRSEVLRTRMKFDLDWMYDLMVNKYGPLDWRSTFAHALYWSDRGNEMQKGRLRGNTGADSMNTARLVKDSLQGLIGRGRLTVVPNFDDPFNSYVEESPDTRFIPFAFQTYQRLGLEQWPEAPTFEDTPFFRGFVSYVQNWIELLYFEGGEKNLALAEKFYVYLREKNKHPDGSTQEAYLVTLDEFVQGTITDQLMTYKQGPAIIRSFIYKSLKHLSLSQRELSLAQLKRARTGYDFWMIDTRVDPNERRQLQPFEIEYHDGILNFMKARHIAPLAKTWLWKELGLAERQQVYRELRPYFEKLCSVLDPPWDVARAFPAPLGMEDVHEDQIEYRGQPRQEGVSTGERYKD